jgi:hypothetical protein
VPEENREKKSHAVKEMIRMLNSQETSKVHVMLLKYYIDTEPYSTSALTVSEATTPNLLETPEGFKCDAFFLPDMLRPQEKQGKTVINGVIRVSLYVNLDDIIRIFAMSENAEAIPLYSPAGNS